MTALTDYLEQAAAFARRAAREGWRYSSYEALLLTEGRTYPWRPRAGRCEKQPDRECYANALHLAVSRPELAYVEGYAASIIPVLHAWCVDVDGTVLDPTWNEDRDDYAPEYVGIAMDVDVVDAVAHQQGYYGIIGNDWMNDGRLLREGAAWIAQGA